MRIFKHILTYFCFGLIFAVCTNTSQVTASSPKTFQVGETWTVDGQWSLTVLGATETANRNQFSDKNPAAVYIVDYIYTNLGYEKSYFDGLFISLEDTIVDSTGVVGFSYPGDITNYPKETPIGATCIGQACIGVNNAGTFKIMVSQYDGKNKKQSATFVIDPTLPVIDASAIASGSVDNSSALQMGQTWVVDGQWSLTITGVTKTNARNQFSDKNPAAVYIVDYTYTNLGYEKSYFDGVFISLDDMIVDSQGVMGYSYPGDITYYAKEIPVGATCMAQECIGVDHAGSFSITVSQYDGKDKKQTQTFYIATE